MTGGRRTSTWLLWTTFALLVLVIGIALLRGCALVFPVASWNFCPGTSGALAAELARSGSLDAQAKQLELELQKQKLACASTPPAAPPPLELPSNAAPPSPQQVMVLPPEPPKTPPPADPPKEPPKPPPKQVDLPADRWAKKDLGVLDGCWVLGKPTKGVLTIGQSQQELCTINAGTICFVGGQGRGQREETAVCPSSPNLRCRAPITATFNPDGTVHTTQPRVPCTPSSNNWAPSTLDCRRVDETLAICRSPTGQEHEFRRAR